MRGNYSHIIGVVSVRNTLVIGGLCELVEPIIQYISFLHAVSEIKLLHNNINGKTKNTSLRSSFKRKLLSLVGWLFENVHEKCLPTFLP